VVMPGGEMDPVLERILNSMDQKIDKIDRRFDQLDVKVDHINTSTVSKSDFDAYLELRRSTTRWFLGTIITIMLSVMAAVVAIITTRPDLLGV